MKRVIIWLKNLRPVKAFIIVLAGMFMFLGQACTRPGMAAQTPQPPLQPPNSSVYNPTTNYPDATYGKGVNFYSDVEHSARVNENEAKIRANELIENAQRNVQQKGIDSREQYLRNYQSGTPLDKRVKNFGEDIGGSAEDLREDVTRGTQRGVENLQENTQNAAKGLTKNIQRAAEDVQRNVQRTIEGSN